MFNNNEISSDESINKTRQPPASPAPLSTRYIKRARKSLFVSSLNDGQSLIYIF
jgi:hypothetical protein